MSLRQDSSTWQAPDPFLWKLLRNNIPILTFLVLAASGMISVYWFYKPPEDGIADAVAAVADEDSLAAPIFKKIPSRPVAQRFAQTDGPLRIAIIAGHMNHDSGAVCADGLTEADINLKVTHKVVAALEAQGIRAEVFGEFDPRLDGYVGTALISIHADSCVYINDQATGFKIAGSSFTDSSELSTCLEDAYREATNLTYHANTITPDMTDNHAFRKIAPGVPAIIIELGFMYLDREILTTKSDLPAEGIVNGVLCFLESRGGETAGSN